MERRTLIIGAVAFTGFGAIASTASAAPVVAFDPKAFAASQAAGESIVVFVHAPW